MVHTTGRSSHHHLKTHVSQMVRIAKEEFGSGLDQLRRDPYSLLDSWHEVELRLVEDPSTPTAKRCSVAGSYVERDDLPPLIQVANAASPGRRAFTALHELGHHLQRTRAKLAEILWTQNGPDVFEDQACDAFAADILIPDEVLNTTFYGHGPTAADVIALCSKTNASRSAVCVKAAQQLPAPGHVALVDGDGEIFFAASSGLPPLARGSNQTSVGPLARGLESGAAQGRGRFRYRDAIVGDELFIQCTQGDEFLVVVAVTDSAPWQALSIPTRDTGPRAKTYECSSSVCGAQYTSFEATCPRCHIPPCPECGRCDCPPALAEQTCHTCWLVKPAAGFIGDTCADCSY